jgi:hypothetical protein
MQVFVYDALEKTLHCSPIDDPSQKKKTKKTFEGFVLPEIHKLLEKDTCKGNVQTTYVEEAVLDNRYVFLQQDAQGHSVGFVLAEPQGEGLYLDVICSSLEGSRLLAFFLKFAEDHAFVELSSLPSVLLYYPKFGFEYKNDCSRKMRPFSKVLREKMAVLAANKVKFGSNDEAYKDPTMAKFMTELTMRRLNTFTANNKCAKVKTEKDLNRWDCAKDGFTMVRCATRKRPLHTMQLRNRTLLKRR